MHARLCSLNRVTSPSAVSSTSIPSVNHSPFPDDHTLTGVKLSTGEFIDFDYCLFCIGASYASPIRPDMEKEVFAISSFLMKGLNVVSIGRKSTRFA